MDVVSRVFQAGATLATYDKSKFATVAKSLNRVLASEEVDRMFVVTNTQTGNKLAEVVDDNGIAPTTIALQEMFGSEGRVIPLQYSDWGKNPGSAMAVTHGCEAAIANGAEQVMVWSPELVVSPAHISRALAFMEARGLDCVGFHREGWFHKLQYHVFQNTGTIYTREALVANEYFSADCDGNTGRTVDVEGFGSVPLAGMDDFHFLLRYLKLSGSVRWGMICRELPLPWDTNFEPGSQRALLHAQKVARQEAVMYQYVEDIFKVSDRRAQNEVLGHVFQGMQMD